MGFFRQEFREGNGNPLQYSCLENPREGEPGGLLSMGLHRVGHDGSDLAAAAAAGFLLGIIKTETDLRFIWVALDILGLAQ